MSPVRALMVAAVGFSIAAAGSAQYTISAHSGLVQLTMGTVYLKDQPIHKTITNLINVGDGDVLRTGQDGLAEVLLTPGVFLRVGHSASIRMDSNSLTDTRMTVLTGSAMVEADELLPDNKLSFQVGNVPVQVVKKGLYRLDGNPAAVATIDGELFVGGTINEAVKKGKDLRMDASDAELAKLHVDKKEDLYAFSKARSEDSAYATGVTSSSFAQSGYSAASGCSSSWYFMGSVGMYSYLPCGGILGSPFGYGFYGLNSAYLWDGPGYYIPPYALLSGYAPSAVAGGGVAKTGFGSGTMPRVPVFSGPAGIRSMPASAVLSRSAIRAISSGSSATSFRGMSNVHSVAASTGSSMGHIAAVSNAGRSSAYSGGRYSGPSMAGSAASSASSMPSGGGMSSGGSMPSRSGGSPGGAGGGRR
ncbi:MAG TPA: hypothetical protein VHZ07_10720 [Bryobacteraceae bacterium]|jgi:hypothetical protein|nr:hypothetical protein [Bryobacteraceae bacterium]